MALAPPSVVHAAPVTSHLRCFELRVHVPLEEVGVRLVASPVREGDDRAFLVGARVIPQGV